MASRRFKTIDMHVSFMAGLVCGPTKVLDLACGPGLYASRFTGLGYEVRGIDFGPASIEYGFYGKNLSAHDAYMKGVEAKFKGNDKPKMLFYCDILVSSYDKVVEVVNENGITNIDLPKYKEAYTALPQKEHAFPVPHLEADGYDYYMVTFKSMYRNQSGNTATNPILNEVVRDNVRNSVWINPVTAASIGVSHGENVKLESRVGSITAKAKVTEGIRPDTLGMSYHYGQWSGGLPEYARKGAWINKILEQHPCLISGMDSFNDTKVRISKA